MIKLYCDVCTEEIRQLDVLSVQVKNGEHPHNGSTMFKNIDVCQTCRKYLPLIKVDIEFEDLQKAYRENE